LKNYLSLREIQDDLRIGELDLPTLVEGYLKRIEDGARLNAFREVFGEEARTQAQEVQQKIEKGTHGRLAGMVIAIKDNICFARHKVSASSKILEGFESLFSATVVERLIAQDAIIIGRTSCDEFAMGSSNENSAFGPVLNPLDESRVPGGSSGGSAAVVAAGMCLAALGSDTGGSIRQPASFTGLVGLKPTYGMVSRHGLLAYASSFDQIGPITHTVEDSALILDVISGPDEFDTTCAQNKHEVLGYSADTEKKYTFAYYREAAESQALSSEVRSSFRALLGRLKEEGHTVKELAFPYLDYLVPAYYVLTTAEASSNLARYDGVHYGYRSPNAYDLESTYRLSRSEGFGTEVQRRIMLGTFVLSSGYYDAYFGKGQKARRLIAEATTKILSEADFIISPTTPHEAFEIGKEYTDPTVMYLEDIFTVQANLAGIPAISVPVLRGKSLPVGAQLMANKFEEKKLLSAAEMVMKGVNFHAEY
jgi:aspartyl-tRNA(Asn)/glutamyl-tRNA(Gln) amidotransferase subunit A